MSTPLGEPAPKLCACGCGRPVPEREGKPGRPNRFFSDGCRTKWHNDNRGNRARGKASTSVAPAGPWAELLQTADQLQRLVRTLHDEATRLHPDTVRAQLAQAQADLHGALGRAATAEAEAAQLVEYADLAAEAWEAQLLRVQRDLSEARDTVTAQTATLLERDAEIESLRTAATTAEDWVARLQEQLGQVDAARVRAEAERDAAAERARRADEAAAEHEARANQVWVRATEVEDRYRVAVDERDRARVAAATAEAEAQLALARAVAADTAAEHAHAQLTDALRRAGGARTPARAARPGRRLRRGGAS